MLILILYQFKAKGSVLETRKWSIIPYSNNYNGCWNDTSPKGNHATSSFSLFQVSGDSWRFYNHKNYKVVTTTAGRSLWAIISNQHANIASMEPSSIGLEVIYYLSALGSNCAGTEGQHTTLPSTTVNKTLLEDAVDIMGEEMKTKIHQQVGKFLSKEQNNTLWQSHRISFGDWSQ